MRRSKDRVDTDDAFYGGFLAALDLVFAHGADTIAEEAVATVDEKALLRHARKEEYHNLPELRRAIKEANRRHAMLSLRGEPG